MERAFSQGIRSAKSKPKAPPSLTPFEQYRIRPTRRLRDRLVEANWGLVEKVARRMSHQCDTPFEDLCQEGAIGLTKAIEKFDPSLGNAFSSFAVPKIRGEIMHYLRDKGWGVIRVPQQAAYEYSRVKGAQRRLIALGRELPEEQIASGLGIKPQRWQFVKEVRELEAPTSIEACEVDIEDDSEAPEDLSWVYSYVEALPEPQRRCVIEYAFGQGKVATIAERHNLTTAVTQELIDSAFAVMRSQITQEHGYGS